MKTRNKNPKEIMKMNKTILPSIAWLGFYTVGAILSTIYYTLQTTNVFNVRYFDNLLLWFGAMFFSFIPNVMSLEPPPTVYFVYDVWHLLLTLGFFSVYLIYGIIKKKKFVRVMVPVFIGLTIIPALFNSMIFFPFGFVLWSFVTIPGGFALYSSLRKDFSSYFQEIENENQV